MRFAMVGPFGLRSKMTMTRRALPIAHELAARGHDVCIIVPPWDSPEDGSVDYVDQGVQVIQVLARNRIELLRAICTSVRMVRAVLITRPQVVHCFKPKAHSGLVHLILWLLRLARIWSGVLIVDEDDWEGRGGWNERSQYSRPLRWLFAWQEQWGLRHGDAVTVASHWLHEQVAQTRNDPAGVHYTPNCVDPVISGMAPDGQSEAQRTDHPLSVSPLVILVTRFVETMPSDICAIWQEVLRESPTSRLLVVGGGLRNEEKLLLAESTRLGIAASISMIGWVPRDRIRDHYRRADVAIMPSDDSIISRAKFPTRLLDAMAAGLPIVASDVGESSYLIQNGESGLLVPSGDASGFAQVVVRLLEDEDLRANLGARAATVAHDRYGCSRLVDSLERLYTRKTRRAVEHSGI